MCVLSWSQAAALAARGRVGGWGRHRLRSGRHRRPPSKRDRDAAQRREQEARARLCTIRGWSWVRTDYTDGTRTTHPWTGNVLIIDTSGKGLTGCTAWAMPQGWTRLSEPDGEPGVTDFLLDRGPIEMPWRDENEPEPNTEFMFEWTDVEGVRWRIWQDGGSPERCD